MESVLAVPRRDKVIVIIIAVVLGLAAGIAAPYVISWGLSVEWVPFQGPMRMLQALTSRVGSWLLIVIGLVAGLVIAAGLIDQMAKIRISDRDIVLDRGKKKQRFARAQVSLALVEDKQLVLRDERDADLVREQLDVPPEQVVAALRRHSWPLEE